MAILDQSGAGGSRRRQEGGTKSLPGASSSGPTGRTSLPVLYQVPLDAAPGVMYMLANGEVISAAQANALIAGNAVSLVKGAPLQIQQQMVNGKFPTSLIPGIEDPNVMQFLAVPDAPAVTGGGGPGDGGGAASVGGSSGSSQEQTFQPIAPPVFDILDRLQSRRQAVREASRANFDAILGASPTMVNPDARFFPGLEPGGLASIALGQASGLGTEGAEGLIPNATREFFRVPLPGLADPQEPSLQSEFGGAMGLAKQILDAIRLFQTGSASSAQSSTGGSTSSPSLSAYDELIAGLIGAPAL